MLIAQVHNENVSAEDLENVKKSLVEYFLAVKDIKIASLYIQYHTGVSNAAPADAPLFLLHGSPCLYEDLLGVKYDTILQHAYV